MTGLTDGPPPPKPNAICSQLSIALGLLTRTEHIGAAVIDSTLCTTLVIKDDDALNLHAGLPCLDMTCAKVKTAMQLLRQTPPEVETVRTALPSLLHPFDAETNNICAKLESAEYVSFLAERRILRKQFLHELDCWTRSAQAQCASFQRVWHNNDTLEQSFRVQPNGFLVQFPLNCAAAAAVGGSGDNEETPLSANVIVEEDANMEQQYGSSEDFERNSAMDVHGKVLAADEAFQVAVHSASCLLMEFANDMRSYFEGTFNKQQGRRKKQGQGFGTRRHLFYAEMSAAECDYVDEMSMLDVPELNVFNQMFWLLAEEAKGKAAASRLHKLKLEFSQRAMHHNGDIMCAKDHVDSFCNVILQILQHSQWCIAPSSAMLLNSLSPLDHERTQQLELVHCCLRAWVL